MNTALHDPCLGGVATSINDYGMIGIGGAYPVAYGNKTVLQDVTTNVLTIRFWFRATDNWKSQTGLGFSKFLRVYGNEGTSDPSSLIVHMNAGGTNTQFHIFDPSGTNWSGWYGTTFTAGADVQDGNWHSMTTVITRNNDTNGAGNVTAQVWFDDWNMVGRPQGVRTVTCSSFGNAFRYFQVAQNWSNTKPTELMGIDFDDIEVWNGTPTSLSSPGGVRVIAP